jgi:hypothetical protein
MRWQHIEHIRRRKIRHYIYYYLDKKKFKSFYKFFLYYILYKMPSSSWITHVKDYAKKNNISYKDALKKAKMTYKKTK